MKRKLLEMNCTLDEYDYDGRCCKLCPKGTYLSSHCAEDGKPQCSRCPEDHYTETNNYIASCLLCRACLPDHHLIISKPCTAESNTKCECMEGYYCTQTSNHNEQDCDNCELIHRCPPGKGVSVPPKKMQNTVCEPCPAGTFNNETDYHTPCRNHTSCSALGQRLMSAGTAARDATCGDIIPRCHWMLPAGLWVGLILTILLVFVLMCLKHKRRRKAVITSVSSENTVLPALPPDVIKHPRSPELQAPSHYNKPCAEEDTCTLEYDGASVNVIMYKYEGAYSIPNTCTSLISNPYRSEPQEDDWPGP